MGWHARRLELADAASTVEYANAQARVDPAQEPAVLDLGGGAAAIYAGPRSPVSRAIGLGMGGTPVSAGVPDVLAALKAAEAFFRVRRVEARVDLCPYADETLGHTLAARGYEARGLKDVWVVELGKACATKWEPKHGSGSGPITARAALPSEYELWVAVVSEGFLGRRLAGPEDTEVARPQVSRPTCVPVLAFEAGGCAVGGGLVQVSGGLAMLRSQSTLTAWRGRGAQQAVIRESLRLGAQAGCDLAVVQTTPGTGSGRNVERAGFRRVYTKTTMVLDRAQGSSG